MARTKYLLFIVLFFVACSRENFDFKSIEKIDTHVHIRYNGPEFLDQAAADNFKVVTILVDHYDIPWQRTFIEPQRQHHPDQFVYATSFTMKGWDEPDWQQKTISQLDKDFANGAVGVKVWKNIGMVDKDKDGNFIMIDDPKFDPIFDFIESKGKTLIGHIGEPRDCWLPLDEMVAVSNRNYYKNHPQYHMYRHPDYPSYDEILASVKRMLAKHPTIRYVGAHLASMEWSPEEMAKFLDQFPNAALDMAARIDDLQYLDQKKVRQFLIDYQDRILYATDLGINEESNPVNVARRMHETWINDWKYFATDSMVNIEGSDQQVQGLALPHTVIKKIYRENAIKWFPELGS